MSRPHALSRFLPVRHLALAAALGALLAAPALAACSSSTGPDGTKAAPAPVQDTESPGGAAAASGVALPSVTNAKDLKTKPVPAAGKGAPPVTLKTGDLVVGSGQAAVASNSVTVQYVGTLWTNGKQFDSSWDRGQAATFALSQVIPGFKDGIVGMKVGGRREIVIPPNLGYGDQAADPIPANSTLVFVVDLQKVQ
ncbi:MAG: FKBP-type peptidyl-prolyl cis-trans isomerase [Frankia sp.]